jgi:phosphotransacetylase
MRNIHKLIARNVSTIIYSFRNSQISILRVPFLSCKQLIEFVAQAAEESSMSPEVISSLVEQPLYYSALMLKLEKVDAMVAGYVSEMGEFQRS